MKFPEHYKWDQILAYYSIRIFAILVLFFLIFPIFVVIPLSFNVEPYFTFSDAMLSLQPEAFSIRWYENIISTGMQDFSESDVSLWFKDFSSNSVWLKSFLNSIFIAIVSTILAVSLGTLAALGLSRPEMPFRTIIMSILISPMIVPLIISAAGMFFFYAYLNLVSTYTGIILAHTIVGIPFVVITVTATLMTFDFQLVRAAQSMGADMVTIFRKIIAPIIAPGIISGGLFAFITSFDEIVIALFLTGPEQRTIPRQMWSGIREQISPTILSVATILIIFSAFFLLTLELLRRKKEKGKK